MLYSSARIRRHAALAAEGRSTPAGALSAAARRYEMEVRAIIEFRESGLREQDRT